MTNEQKRIVIAEACGWHNIRVNPTSATRFAGNKEANPLDGALFAIPDYFNDLNAMHEAEKALTDEQRTEYDRKLGFTRTPHGWLGPNSAVSATAAQRAEAFVRTIGK